MKEKKIGDFTEAHLLKRAKEVVEEKTKDSAILDVHAEDRIPKFDEKELTLGKVLGRGGFCVVQEVNKIKDGDTQNKKSDEDEHFIHNIVQDRGFMAAHVIRKGKDYRYAVKKMQDSSRKDPQTFINSVVDLAVEARFLSVVRHPNIIKMRAMDMGDRYRPEFFVVLDKLYDIMPIRLQKWKKQKKGGLNKMMFDRKGNKQAAFWVERLTVAYDIACALKYLHALLIIYRDLKPDNVGFDVRGDVKIFDFGLAKEIDPRQMDAEGTYKLTADTGSLRYMAPEVARGKPYNETCDTFSFSVLCWQMLALETPYEGYSVSMFQKKVIDGGSRPKPDESWGTAICTMLREAFVDNAKRPTMEDVTEIMRDEINQLSDDSISDVLDASRKSAMSAN